MSLHRFGVLLNQLPFARMQLLLKPVHTLPRYRRRRIAARQPMAAFSISARW